MKKTTPYRILAKYYDDFAGKDRYKKWHLLLEETVKKYEIKLDFAIDLACGTGTNTGTLKKLGFNKVYGVDKSKAMLDEAKKKYRNIDFFKKDFLHFGGNRFSEASLVTCFYDSLNYLLSESDLEKAFANVYSILNQGGIFLFDLNTPEHAKGIASNPSSIFTKDDLSVTIKNSCSNDFWFLDLYISTKNKNNSFNERHIEKTYTEKTIKKILKRVGFKIIDIKKEYKKYHDGKTYNNRIYYIVKK